MSNLQIVIERLFPDVELPNRATAHSAGFDLKAYLNDRPIKWADGKGNVSERPCGGTAGARTFEIAPGTTALIPLGFKARVPRGFEAQLRPRSGNSFRRNLMIPNSPATIDADYPDEWMVLVRNLSSTEPLMIANGERIAQMVLARHEEPVFVEGPVAASTDRRGGLGSTGS